MASQPTRPSERAPGPGFFEQMAAQPEKVSYALVAVLIALAAVPVTLLLVYKGWNASPQLVVVTSSILLLMVMVTAGIHSMNSTSSTVAPADRVRILVLLLAAEIGCMTAITGLCLPWTDRFSDRFSSGAESLSELRGAILLCGGLFFGGLILMFLGLQLARTFERSRADLRRLLYGYNAILGVMLIASGLALVNRLAYTSIPGFSWLNHTVDWTSSRIYTLKPNTITMLTALKQPVKVYVLMPHELPRKEVVTLLDNFRSYSPQLRYETVSRDRDSARLRELQSKYLFREAAGMLVVLGEEGSEVSEFIKYNDLFASSGMGREEESSFRFKGEGAMMQTLQYLLDGKSKTRIYFTQGHGEMPGGAGGPAGPGEDSMSRLWSQLNQGNYESKPLQFSPDVTEVPKDADVLVIARPQKQFAKKDLDILRDYLNRGGEKKGKLIVLLESRVVGDKIPPTGLEEFLKEFNVSVQDDRVLQASDDIPNPDLVQAMASEESQTPIAALFTDAQRNTVTPFLFRRCRTVESSARPEGGGSRFTVNTLMYAMAEYLWVEKVLTENIDRKAAIIKSDPVERAKIIVEGNRASIAVTVTEPRRGARPNDPHAFRGGEQQPKLVVFGTSSWVSNSEMSGPYRGRNIALFTSCVSWLRERPDVTLDDPGLERPMYTPNVKKEEFARLFFQPLLLVALGVVTLGGAVWVVRRR